MFCDLWIKRRSPPTDMPADQDKTKESNKELEEEPSNTLTYSEIERQLKECKKNGLNKKKEAVHPDGRLLNESHTRRNHYHDYSDPSTTKTKF